MASLHDSEEQVWTYTVPEAADLLRIGRTAAYEAVRTGQLPSLRIGRRILIPAVSLRGLLGRKEGQDRLVVGSSNSCTVPVADSTSGTDDA